MFRKPLIFSCFCILASILIGVYVWYGLPEMDKYPIHWNAKGEADGFGSKNMVLINLSLMPITLIFMTAILWAVPKFEPRVENLKASRKAYSICWMLVSALLLATSLFIASFYLENVTLSGDGLLRLIVISMSILFIGIGNVMGKVRPNFMFGIRTPWTLSSDLSWEKTHRVGGRLFVANGIIPIIVSIFKPVLALFVFIGLTFIMLAVVFIYSYQIWKSDPNKKS